MSQTYFNEEEYAKEFENVVANVTEGTRFWLVDKEYDYPKLGIMPNGIHGPVSTAAYRGFLYDKDGNQIWDLGKAVRNEEIGEEGYKKGEYYLHFGDQTYHIFNDPHESEYIREGDKVSLKPITENLPEFKQTAPTRPRAPEKPQEVAKPQLNGFWSFMDKAVNFFTGGKRHLPSVEKYNL